jgi:putative transcriptional regulator
MVMRKRKSALVRRLLNEGREWHRQGLISDENRRGYGIEGMQMPEPLLPHEVRAIRRRDNLELSHFAMLIATTPRHLRRWEQGSGRPKGPALRLLHLVRERGVYAVFLPAELQ